MLDIKQYNPFRKTGDRITTKNQEVIDVESVEVNTLRPTDVGTIAGWWDTQDMSTMFQDEAGTIPVTAVEQPVSLHKDKSGLGRDRYTPSASSTSRPTLSARYNQLEDTETLSTQTVTTIVGSYTLTFSGAGSIDLTGTATQTYTAGTHTFTATAGTLTVTVTDVVTEADLKLTIDAHLPYQRVTTSTDYDTEGFPMYLSCDGSNDFMRTANIEWGSDQVTMVTGLTKLDANDVSRFFMEFGLAASAYDGIFGAVTPPLPPNKYEFFSKGTTAQVVLATSDTYKSPVSDVYAGIGDISGDISRLRIDGTTITTNTGDQGTGNYLTYPLYFFSRFGTNAFFLGRAYSTALWSTVLTGADLTDQENLFSQEMEFGYKGLKARNIEVLEDLTVGRKGVFGDTITVGAYTLPATDGTNGQVLVTNGSGVLTWTTL